MPVPGDGDGYSHPVVWERYHSRRMGRRTGRRAAVLIAGIVVAVAVVVLVATNPSSVPADLASVAMDVNDDDDSSYSSWLRRIGAGGFAPAQQDVEPVHEAGPFMNIKEKDNVIKMPADYIRSLEAHEKREERRLSAIKRMVYKHSRLPESIQVNFNKPAQAGPDGPPGVQGPTGPPGPKGYPGVHGPQGTAGAVGPPGPSGPPGVAGGVGPPGDTGPQGPQGPAGVNGTAGDEGNVGRPGLQGLQGPPGTPGAVGAQGGRGMDGPAGSPGPQGTAGAPGRNGVPLLPAFNGKIAVFAGLAVANGNAFSHCVTAVTAVPGVTSVEQFSLWDASALLSMSSTDAALVIPSLALTPTLTTAAAQALRTSITSGLTMVVMGSSGSQAVDFINTIIGTSLTAANAGTCSPTKQQGTAATRFDTGPNTLAFASVVWGINTASIGTDARIDSMYACGDTSEVLRIKVGQGNVVFVGYDWEASATASDWVNVLNAALKFGAPVPATTAAAAAT